MDAYQKSKMRPYIFATAVRSEAILYKSAIGESHCSMPEQR